MLHAKNKVGLVFFPAYDWAISPNHPEREERLLYTQDQILDEGLFDIEGVVELKPDPVVLADIQRVHFCVPDVWSIATESHFISAGGAKTIPYKRQMENDSTKVLELAVRRMLDDNKLRDKRMKRLRIFAGAQTLTGRVPVMNLVVSSSISRVMSAR